ncbi:MAG TPA: hypothetical protein VLL52_17270 [Anaerolineae bacterium]|nr:hypothetical protein [Anaerolineae bacterium]
MLIGANLGGLRMRGSKYIQRLGRILRKQGNATAVLYEVIARDTVDEGMAQRRRAGARRRQG